MSRPPRRLNVIRPDDLVVLTFRFHDLELERGPDGGKQLVPAAQGVPRLVVDVQPQALGEEAFLEGRQLSPRGAVGGRLSRPSRLVFLVPAGEDPIPFTLAGLLDAARRLPLGVPARPQRLTEPLTADQKARVLEQAQRGPDAGHTALELPYGLVLAPDTPEGAQDPGRFWQWLHASKPSVDSGHVELWHSRLGRRDRPEAVRPQPKLHLRARWPGLDTVNNFDPASKRPRGVEEETADFGSTLLFRHRNDLVLYGNVDVPSVPPIEADRLLLSSLGAWFDGNWTAAGKEPPGKVVAWNHRMTMGRDHYVRVVERGYLFPFGHKAVHVQVSERKLQPGPDGVLAGYTRKREFIVVREREREYHEQGQPTLPLRAMPFTCVRVETSSTPLLDAKEPIAGTSAFWPRVGDQDFEFRLVAIDHAGAEVPFTSPLAFLPAEVAEGGASTDKEQTDALRRWMAGQTVGGQPGFGGETDEKAARHLRPMAGRCITFADPAATTSGRRPDSTFETESLQFRAEVVPRDAGGPPFRPLLKQARALVPAVQRMTGAASATPVPFAYDDTYVAAPTNRAKGLPDPEHKLDVFARLESPLGVNLSAESAGGLVAPSMATTALSQSFGPVGGKAADLAAGVFSPGDLFGDADGGPKLLGGIPLTKIVGPLTFANAAAAVSATRDPSDATATRLPSITSTTLGDGTVVTQFSWHTRPKTATEPNQLRALTAGLLTFTPGDNGVLSLDAIRRAPANGDPPTTSVVGTLTDFELVLASGTTPFVALPFHSIEFRADSGKKVDVAVNVGTVQFRGPLSFVNTLAAIIPPEGFLDPPALTATPQGVNVSYGLGLPTVGLGYLTLMNLSLSAGFNLPLLEGSTSLTFHFSERHDPFIVTYSALGGGGYFGLELDTNGIRMLEASFEFGGAVALNLGVAAGAASITAGIYYGEKDGLYALAGFVRCCGELHVLGILTISAQFYLELMYVGPPTNPGTHPKVTGTASLTVEIELLFISKSVTVTVQREFSKGSDPTFEDTMPELALWQAYCDSFADEGG